MAKQVGVGNKAEYFERLAVYLFFACCAVLSIVLWVFNWVCWKRKCCCFVAFEEYTNKVFSWWLCWVFLCGVLACCIAGFVTANRFGFSLYGIQCAYERVYYDTIFGQQKNENPRWEGEKTLNDTTFHINSIVDKFSNMSINLTNLDLFFSKNKEKKEFMNKDKKLDILEEYLYRKILPNKHEFMQIFFEEEQNIEKTISESDNLELFYLYFSLLFQVKLISINYDTFRNPAYKLKSLNEAVQSLGDYKKIFIKDFTYYVHVARAMGKIVPIIYFSLLLIFVVGSGALLITYYCKKVNQQWWILPMHIAWNGLRFFIFSFFMYGCAYGMLFLGSRDAIAYLKYGAFDERNLNENNNDDVIIIPKKTQNFFKYCLLNNTAYEDLKENKTLNEFVKTAINLNNKKDNDFDCQDYGNDTDSCNEFLNIKGQIDDFLNNGLEDELTYFQKILKRGENIYDQIKCSFVGYDINLMYRAMWDFAWETRILCALSCCIGFFGEIAVYSFLWVMHLWRRDDNNYNSYNKSYNKIKVNNDITNKRKKKIKNIIAPPKDIDDDVTNTELAYTDKNYDDN